MSKLDDIFEYDTLSRLHGETKAVAKGKIKQLFIDIVDEVKDSHPDNADWSNEYLSSREIINKIETL